MSTSIKPWLAATVVAFLAGGLSGWSLGQRGAAADEPAPAQWVARIGDQYISAQDFIDEMRHRGGERTGHFQEPEQRRQLLDDLVYRAALVQAAEQAGLTRQPALRRRIEQVISNRYVQDNLRREERGVQISDAEVEAYYQQHADQYAVPARKRLAVLRIGLEAGAGEPAWKAAMARLEEARGKVAGLQSGVPHFGSLAQEYSDDSASRYRGGVIGWIAEGRSDRYSHDPSVIEAARALQEPGSLSEVLRGRDGVYLVRLVESEPRQSRSLEQLAGGIRQRLLQERLETLERQFRQRLLGEVGVEVRESVLATIAPLSAPAAPDVPQPPAMPVDQG